MPWMIFLLSAAVILVAGTKLSQYGDQIAEQTGLGGVLIGVVLMAGATSLPEVLTTVSAVLLPAPDLAVGDLFGAVMTNMFTLGIIEIFYRRKRVWQQAAYEHILVAALAMTLTGLAGLFIVLRTDLTLWGVGMDSLCIAAVYVLGMRVMYRQENERRRQREKERVVEAEEQGTKVSANPGDLRRAGIGFAVATLAIVVAAPSLAVSAKKIAEVTGIGTTFVGTSLVAVATSLPELVTSFAAVRLGAFDLAVGNLFGSNAFNMSVLFVVDIAYRPGSLLSAVSDVHTVSALLGILLMNIGLMGIFYRAEKRFVLIEPDGLLFRLGA
jgi:cation:H+ antiporter